MRRSFSNADYGIRFSDHIKNDGRECKILYKCNGKRKWLLCSINIVSLGILNATPCNQSIAIFESVR